MHLPSSSYTCQSTWNRIRWFNCGKSIKRGKMERLQKNSNHTHIHIERDVIIWVHLKKAKITDPDEYALFIVIAQ
jgi:hypothetical protein